MINCQYPGECGEDEYSICPTCAMVVRASLAALTTERDDAREIAKHLKESVDEFEAGPIQGGMTAIDDRATALILRDKVKHLENALREAGNLARALESNLAVANGDALARRLRCEQLEQRIAVLERASLADVAMIREQRELLDAFRERAEAAEKRAEVAEAKLAPAKLALEQAHKTATGRAAEMIYDALAAIADVKTSEDTGTAKAAYDRYYASAGGIDHDNNRGLATWEELDERMRAAWEAAVKS